MDLELSRVLRVHRSLLRALTRNGRVPKSVKPVPHTNRCHPVPSSEFSTFNPETQRKCANGAGGDAVVTTINAAPRRRRVWSSARPRPGRIPATPEGSRGPAPQQVPDGVGVW